MMSGNEFVRYSLFEEQGQRDVPTMIFEQLSMALFGLLVAVRRGVTFLSVMVNGIQSTNALSTRPNLDHFSIPACCLSCKFCVNGITPKF